MHLADGLDLELGRLAVHLDDLDLLVVHGRVIEHDGKLAAGVVQRLGNEPDATTHAQGRRGAVRVVTADVLVGEGHGKAGTEDGVLVLGLEDGKRPVRLEVSKHLALGGRVKAVAAVAAVNIGILVGDLTTLAGGKGSLARWGGRAGALEWGCETGERVGFLVLCRCYAAAGANHCLYCRRGVRGRGEERGGSMGRGREGEEEGRREWGGAGLD